MRIILFSLAVMAISVTSMPYYYPLQSDMWMLNNRPTETFTCDLCKLIAEQVNQLILSGRNEDEIAKIVVEFCTSLQIESPRVCDLIVKEFRNEVFSVAKLHYFSPEEICGSLPLVRICPEPYKPGSDWNVTFPKTKKPPVVPIQPPKAGSPEIKILHVTDLHLDVMYEAGSNAECGEPLCCRSNDGPGPGDKAAGKFGDYRHCDTPIIVLDSLFKHVDTNEDFDFVYLTGDLPAHDVWNQSRSDQIHVLNVITELFLKFFPKIKVYAAVGNHESAPVNSFPPPYVKGKNSIDWLYEKFYNDWVVKSGWLPEDAKEDILRGAYFTTLVQPGFRVISLNMNYGHSGNFWLQINDTDPAGMLQWLIGVLQRAEDANEKVHILGHVPPSGTKHVFSRNYHEIITRYESTITGQFFGHTHHDSFEIFYENHMTKRPTNVAYVAGSVTTYVSVNPGYRIYTVDGNYKDSSWAVLDHVTSILNITEANMNNKAVWQKEYSAKDAFQMKALQPADWDDVVQRMKENTTLFNEYYKFNSHSYDGGPCDEGCRKGNICDLQISQAGDNSYCDP